MARIIVIGQGIPGTAHVMYTIIIVAALGQSIVQVPVRHESNILEFRSKSILSFFTFCCCGKQ